jgi:hypothetical protein
MVLHFLLVCFLKNILIEPTYEYNNLILIMQ